MRILTAVAIATSVFFWAPARADTTSSLANALAVEQVVDAIETTAAIRGKQCVTTIDPAYPVARTICGRIFVEEDPLARPFEHSLPLSLSAAGLVNFGVRRFGERAPVSRFALAAAVVLYPLLLEHNAHVLHATLNVRF